jgi:hypothetical protein
VTVRSVAFTNAAAAGRVPGGRAIHANLDLSRHRNIVCLDGKFRSTRESGHHGARVATEPARGAPGCSKRRNSR